MRIKFIRSYGPYTVNEIVDMQEAHALWYVRNAVAVKCADKPAAKQAPKKAKK